MAFKITKKEFKTRMGYLLLGIFASNIAIQIRESVNGSFGTGFNFWIINAIGILLALYLFEF